MDFVSQIKCFSLTCCIRIESKHEVTILGGLNEFVVKFYGPQGSKFVTQPFRKTSQWVVVGNKEMPFLRGRDEQI